MSQEKKHPIVELTEAAKELSEAIEDLIEHLKTLDEWLGNIELRKGVRT